MGGKNSTHSDAKRETVSKEKYLKDSGFQRSSPGFFSHLIFQWITPTLRLGKQRALENEDLSPVIWQATTKELTENLQNLWNNDLENGRKTGKNPRLWKTVLRSLSIKRVLFLITSKLLESGCQLLQAIFLSFLLSSAIEKDTDPGAKTMLMVYLYAFGLCLFSVFQVFFSSHLNYLGYLTGTHVRGAVCGLLYKKVNMLNTSCNERTGHHVRCCVMVGHTAKFDPKYIVSGTVTSSKKAACMGRKLTILQPNFS